MWGGVQFFFHTGAEKGARTDATNWNERWLCLDCFSKDASNLQVNSLKSPVLSSLYPLHSTNSRSRMSSIFKEINAESPPTLSSQGRILTFPGLHHEETPPPLEVVCQTKDSA